MSNVFCYIDGEYQYIDTDDPDMYEEAERLEDSVNSDRCAVCGKSIDWSSELEKFSEKTPLYTPMPVNVCYKCAIKAYRDLNW